MPQKKRRVKEGEIKVEEEEEFLDPQGEVMLDPLMIQHPLSPQWAPVEHVARYVRYWIRRAIPKDVRTRMRSECPRPSLGSKVAYTPELDQRMLPFINKSGKDPRRGLEKGLKGCQDRLLHILGPLTKMFRYVRGST